MSDEAALRKIRQLIDELESDDAFERLRAIESLALLTQQRLDFAWRDPPEERSRSIRRWRRWLDREVRRRKQETTIQILSSGAAGPEVLHKLLETLGPTQKKALLAQMMLAQAAAKGQAVAGHAPCSRCEKRPATVQMTRRVDDGTPGGAWVHEALCEVCAAT
ncbi:MAG: hypothetical protein L0323_04600 [Planctomycetes bacterium]|nr:hypothetical protein [Planctomycetota bacterium]